MVKVSILMPAYNEEKYISEAINSVINQTFKDWELIIINDASTDKTKEIVEKFIKKDKRIKLINNKTNKFQSAAREKGKKQAKGKYIAFLDADDKYLKNKLEKQINFLEKHPDIDLVYTNMLRVFKNGEKSLIQGIKFEEDPRKLLLKAMKRKDLGKIKAHKLINFKKRKRLIPSASVILKRSVFNKVQYDKKLKVSEDYDLWYQIIGKGFKLAKIPIVTYLYRIHEGNTMKRTNLRQACDKIVNEKLKKGIYFK
jgi:glycosyltransferase involved in cell wall biosynthesis